MPIYLALPYIIVEALAFWGIARWLGVGTALLLLIGSLFLGMFLAAFEMRSIARRLDRGTAPGRAAGDFGLTAAGALCVALPGFVTTAIGLLLMFGPTRAIVRGVLAKKLRALIEDIGVRSFETAASFQPKTQYGSFSQDVIDAEPEAETPSEEEIRRWSESLDPDAFGESKRPKDDHGDDGSSADKS